MNSLEQNACNTFTVVHNGIHIGLMTDNACNVIAEIDSGLARGSSNVDHDTPIGFLCIGGVVDKGGGTG